MGRQLHHRPDQEQGAAHLVALRAGAADRLDPAGDLQGTDPPPQDGRSVVQERHHVQHGRVCGSPRGASRKLPLVHVEQFLQARRHQAGERQHSRRQRRRPGQGVRRLRGAHRRGRGHRPLHGRRGRRRTHRLQRAVLVAQLPHAPQDPDAGHDPGQRPVLRRRHLARAENRADGRRGHGAVGQEGADPRHGPQESPRGAPRRRRLLQPPVDHLGPPGAPQRHSGLRRPGRRGAARSHLPLFQGHRARKPDLEKSAFPIRSLPQGLPCGRLSLPRPGYRTPGVILRPDYLPNAGKILSL